MRHRTTILLTAIGLVGCAAPCPRCPPPATQPPFAYGPPPAYAPASPPPTAVSAPPAPKERPPVAVLPIEDDTLFRAERAELRALLARELARRAPDFTITPLAELEPKLRPISKAGVRCAFDGAPLERRARAASLRTTHVYHLVGFNGSKDTLEVAIDGWDRRQAAFSAPWNRKLDVLARYQAAFAALERLPETQGGVGGLLGGLGTSGVDPNQVREGPVSLCEARFFGACAPETKGWRDRAGELATCFAGEDENASEVLVEGGATPKCELTDLDDLGGPDGKREACLCRALTASAGMQAKPGRRVLQVRFEAPDLAGKRRPELRVVEATRNLHADADWHSVRSGSIRRLVVDHLDAFAPPLARCAPKAGAALMADLEVRENGAIGAAHVVPGSAPRELASCVEKALPRGTLTCTDDGKPATLRVAIAWAVR